MDHWDDDGAARDPWPGAAVPVPAPDEDEDDDEAWRASLPQPPRRASERVWKFVRQDYLAGLTAGEVGRRWGIKIGTLRARAAAEGWRRADQPAPPDPAPLPLPARTGDPEAPAGDELAPAAELDAPAGSPADYADLARRALARFERALARDRAGEAATWLRLHARLLDLARLAPAAPASADVEPEPDPIDALSACALEIESIARAAAAVAADDRSAQAALDARAAAVHARISALTGRDDPDPMDSIDSMDSVFAAGPIEPAGPGPEPP